MNDQRAHSSAPRQGRGPTNPFEPWCTDDVEQSIPARFAEQVRRYPSKIAVESATGRLTYEELNRAANRVAAAIMAQRGDTSEPVAMLVSHGAPQVVTVFGILKAGKIYVPLDPSYPPPRSTAVLLDAQPAIIVTDNANRQLAAQIGGGCPIVNMDELDPASSVIDPLLSLSPDRPAVIIYTSGSTGKPTGFVHSHRNVLHAALKYTNNSHINHEDRLLLLFPCAFIGWVGDVFSALLNGATLLPFDLKRQGIGKLAEWMISKEVTTYQSVPTLFRRFVATLNETERFPSLRAVRLGGEPVTRRDVELHWQHFGPDCVLSVALAATEILAIRLFFVDRDASLAGPRIPVGYPTQDTEVLLLDEQGQPVGPGQVGEMTIRSPYLTQGFWSDPQRTAATFRPDPHNPNVRSYCLRDLGLMHADGCLEYLGRKDWQIKIRGHRVEIAEVEAAVLAIPGVKEAILVGQETATGEHKLVAYVVPDDASACTVSTLRGALVEQLPDYLIPAVFVLLKSLPTTPSGKIDHQALPSPTTARPQLRNAYTPPRDPLQIALVEIWRDCLNIVPVGVQDDFFELGGDSMLAVDMALRVESTLSRSIPQEALLSARTVEQLSRFLMQPESCPACAPLTEIQPGESDATFFYFHGDFNGGGLYCAPLARQLGSQIRFVAVHPHGLGIQVVPGTIEEMAQDRLSAIRELQPRGPYRLGGHCNGALVALAMARQLLQDGEEVDFLAMIAPPPLVWWEIPTGGPPSKPRNFPSVDLSEVPDQERARRLLAAYGDACKRFVMRHYPGTLLVVFPKENIPAYAPLYRWQEIADKTPVLVVPGKHLTMLAPRNLQALANVIQQHFPATKPQAAFENC